VLTVKEQASDPLHRWLAEHFLPGTILNLGGAIWPLPSETDEYVMVTVEHLASALDYEAVFDHAWANDALVTASDPANVVRQVFKAIMPGGTLLVTVPFGLSSPEPRRAFYSGSLRRLIQPMFEITHFELIDGYVAIAGQRRDQPLGVPMFSLDPDETAFNDHDRRLNERLKLAAADQVRAGARYRSAVQRTEELRADLDRTKKDLAELRHKLARIRPWLAGPLAVVRGGRRLKRVAAQRTHAVLPSFRGDRAISAKLASAANAGAVGASQRAVGPTSGTGGTAPPASGWRETLRASFEDWLAAARTAEGDEVIVMFSGTTFVQEHRGNRPIRLTNVYLGRKCPVFFNYYRFRETDALPEHPDELLFQSPIDATPMFLDALLTADFGGKKKTFFASFPHELMVRYLTVAAQHGWVTVYDARDDWEEFAKVGMAKWYHPGYERYVATHADLTTAVSRPLARKMSALAGERVVHVMPNGLDTRFPRPAKRGRLSGPPVIGYFGHLTDKWFDWPLVIAAAQRYPDYTFELAGHQQPKLELPPNIKLLGLLGHRELADRSRTWSVALIPFKNGPLADAVDPIKIYEYLHLRLPVLATYFPQCRDYPGTTVTEGREEFLERLPQLVGTELPERETADWLAHNTWECRVNAYADLAAEVRRQGNKGVAALVGVNR